jgi:hypothetical protein
VRIVFLSEDDVNVVLSSEERPGPQKKQLQLPKIDRQNLTAFTDGGRKLECEVTCARTEVDYGLSLLQAHRAKNVRWPLPLIAFFFDLVQPLERICKGVQRVQTQEN